MIGKLFYHMLNSKFGSKVLQSEITEEGLKWTEIGIGRAIFINSIVFFLLLQNVISLLISGTPRFSIIVLPIAMYFRLKLTPMIVELFDDHEKIIEIERKKDFTDKTQFKLLKEVLRTGDVIESVKTVKGTNEEDDR